MDDQVKAKAVEVDVAQPLGTTVPRTRAFPAEWVVAQILRVGAVTAGALFLSSLVLELLPRTELVNVAIDVLRKCAMGALLLTPLVRIVAAGAVLGLRGEPRYALYAAGVLALLGIAVGAGFAA